MKRTLRAAITIYIALNVIIPTLVLFAALETEAPPMPTHVTQVGFTVADLDGEVAFFTQVLEFTKIDESTIPGGKRAHLRLGEETLELTEYQQKGRPIPADAKSNDLFFEHVAIITSDMNKAYARLTEYHVAAISQGPQTIPSWNKAAAGVKAFYFKDPEGHILEVLQFPSDKGDARWHAADHLFLGIDHTAIAVSNTDQSLAFYRDKFGFTIAGGSDNYGIEQERLSGVKDAHVKITTLTPPRRGNQSGIPGISHPPQHGEAHPC